LFSIVLYYLESGLVVLKTVETTPPKQTLKHNFLWNTHTKAEESLQQRAYSAIGTILGSLSEDAISSVTLWDLLLSGLSLCIWAYLQNVHVHSILRTIGLAWDDDPNFPYEPSVTDVSITPEEPSTPGPTIKKRRGRPRKNTTGITDAEQPTKTPVRSPRKLAAPTEVDGEYTPSPKTRGQVAELETLGVSSDVAEQNTGAGALAWVLFLVGGLGTAMSAILGGEVSGG
jgi:hypothetical protein